MASTTIDEQKLETFMGQFVQAKFGERPIPATQLLLWPPAA